MISKAELGMALTAEVPVCADGSTNVNRYMGCQPI